MFSSSTIPLCDAAGPGTSLIYSAFIISSISLKLAGTGSIASGCFVYFLIILINFFIHLLLQITFVIYFPVVCEHSVQCFQQEFPPFPLLNSPFHVFILGGMDLFPHSSRFFPFSTLLWDPHLANLFCCSIYLNGNFLSPVLVSCAFSALFFAFRLLYFLTQFWQYWDWCFFDRSFDFPSDFLHCFINLFSIVDRIYVSYFTR